MIGDRNGHEEEWLTISQAALRLSTSEPRLRRLLQRPEFTDCARREIRQTRTGTRTGTAIPVSVIPRIESALRDRTAQWKQEHERPFAFPSEAVARGYETLLAEKTADSILKMMEEKP